MLMVRLLEYDRPAHSPWLTVALADIELRIQQELEDLCFVMIAQEPFTPVPDLDFGRSLPIAEVERLIRMRNA